MLAIASHLKQPAAISRCTRTADSSTLEVMTIHTTPELEAKLNEIARRTGRDVNTIAHEALEQYVDYEG